MAQGLFNLKQVNQAVSQGAWPNLASQSSYGARFNGTGSGQYLTGPTTGVLNFGTGNFTVEFWANLIAYSGGSLTVAFSASNGGSDFQLSFNAGSQYVYWHNSGIQIGANSSAAFTPGRWAHIALVRSGTNVALFCNGTRYGTVTNSASINLTNFNIGAYWNAVTAYMVEGWISNLRITNTAVYDPTLSTLTLPIAPLTAISGTQLLTLQNATIVDNSTNALSITNNGSVGMQPVAPFGIPTLKTPAVDYLVVAGGGAAGASNSPGGGGAGGVLLGNTPITAGSSITITVGAGGTGTSGSGVNTSGSNSVFGSQVAIGGGKGENNSVAAGDGGSGGGMGGASLGAGQGTLNQGFRGGFTYVSSGSSGGGGAGGVGQSPIVYNAGGQGGNGLGSVITGTMTGYGGGGGGSTGNVGSGYSLPPATYGGGGAGGLGTNGGSGTANTGGGGGGSPSFTGGSGGSGVVVISYPDVYAPATATTGGPIASTSGSGSIYFNGTNQVLVYSANTAFQFGTGNFTWETWVNYLGGTVALFDLGSANSAGSFAVFVSSGVLYVRIDGSGNDLTYTYPAGFINGWVHLAVVRSGTTMTLYYNGVSVASGTRSNNLTQQTPYIGNLNGFTGYYFGGYLSNTRVVKGTAVYTGNFTPSTTPFTAVSGTSLLLNSVSGAYLADSSTNGFAPTTGTVTPTWNASSPFTGTGYKNRVYTFTASGTITF